MTVNVKIVKANISKSPTGRFIFEKLGQAFIDINESNANIFYVSGVVEKKWGSSYVLVTSDGLKIEDSSGTQGIAKLNNTYYYRSILAFEIDHKASQYNNYTKEKQELLYKE